MKIVLNENEVVDYVLNKVAKERVMVDFETTPPTAKTNIQQTFFDARDLEQQRLELLN